MKSNLVIFLLFLGLYSQAQTDRPNVILIISDDLNDYIEPMNAHPDVETPNINRLADNGTTFLNTYCSSPVCAPSRASFLTGKDVSYTQVFGNSGYKCMDFSENFTAEENNEFYYTLPEYLKDTGGYFTYNINKIFHCHYNYIEFDSTEEDPCLKTKAWNKYIQFSDTTILTPIEDATNEGVGAYHFGRLNDTLEPYMMDFIATDSAIQFIESYATNPSAFCDKPFFLALGYHLPHKDQFAPAKYFSAYYADDMYAEPFNYAYNFPENSFPQNGLYPTPQPDTPWSDLYALPEGGVARSMVKSVDTSFQNWANSIEVLPLIDAGLTDSMRIDILAWNERTNALMAYLASVKFIDAQVGRLLDELESKPELLNNSIIIFIGDHGHALGEKKHWGKNALWETDVRTSLIIADFRNPVPNFTNRTVSLLDLFPTICELTGMNLPTFTSGTEYLDGESVYPLMQSPDMAWVRPVLTTVKRTDDDEASCFPQYSVRDEKFHYIRYTSNGGGPGVCDSATSYIEEELYEIGVNREVDPYEWNNLIGDEDYLPVIDYLQQWLPDSALYLSKTYTAHINNEDINCLVENNDTLFLHAEIFDPAGVLVAAPSGFEYRWTNNLTDDVFSGADVIIPMEILPEILFANSQRILVYLEMIDSTTGATAGFDTKYFYLTSADEPVINFNVIQTGLQTVAVTDLTISGGYNSVWWDFGEGVISYTESPGPYTYETPGIYVVTCYVQYGNNPDCIISFQKTISAIESNFIEDEKLKVFPNPAGEFINVVSSLGNLYGDYKIYNSLGQTALFVKNESLELSVFNIDISTLNPGLYFIEHAHHTTAFVVM